MRLCDPTIRSYEILEPIDLSEDPLCGLGVTP